MASQKKIICFANAKGGVGKTKATIALADCLIGVHGRKVLLVDTDQQASASFFMLEGDFSARLRLENLRKTLDYYFEDIALNKNELSLEQILFPRMRTFSAQGAQAAGYGSLIASSDRIDFVEERIVAMAGAEIEFNFTSAAWLAKYDGIFRHLCPRFKNDIIELCANVPHEYVIIDTAAGYRLISMIAMIIADIIIVPTIPDLVSLTSTQRFIAQIHKYETSSSIAIPPMRLLFTKVQPGYQSHSSYISTLTSGPSKGADIIATPFLQRDVISQIDNAPAQIKTFDQKYESSAGNVKAMT